jgi:type I restriction enzyme R subunit
VPFLFATNGRPFLRQIAEKSGIWFLDARQDTNHPRALEAWYTPEGLSQLLQQDIAAADARLTAEPTHYLPLRLQAAAIRAIERPRRRSAQLLVASHRHRTILYRPGLPADQKPFRRILLLVDRTPGRTSGRQTQRRLENLQTFPDI